MNEDSPHDPLILPNLRRVVVPVVDLRRGVAVHARGGRRSDYQPVRSVLSPSADPLALARAFRDELSLCEIYLADLDALAGEPADLNLISAIAELSLEIWCDAGLRGAQDASLLLRAGVHRIVAASETLAGPDVLRELLDEVGPDRLIFSLDLRSGRTLAPRDAWPTEDPPGLISAIYELGVRTALLLDLERVGGGRGVGTEQFLITSLERHPDLEIAVGGGVASAGDVARLHALGASRVLVASALHDGRIGRAELHADHVATPH